MAQLECDLVMKGGVTSGTIYPKAIVRLARHYRFRSIGGTSAGAIAAGAAAAAEYCRQKPGSADPQAGFTRLAGLPDELGKPGAKKTGPKLLELFQPQARFRRLFGLLLSFIGTDRTGEGAAKARGKIATWLLIGRVCLNAMRAFPVDALGGIVLALAALSLLGVQWDSWWRMLAIALTAFGGGAAAAFWGAWRALQALPGNGFGLCRGFEPAQGNEAEDGTQLTAWLHALLQESAGLKADGTPLTFGDLTDVKVDFRAMTTNLNYGLPHQLPFGRGGPWAFFDEKVWLRYFPHQVVEHMKNRPPKRSTEAPKNPNDREYADAVKRVAEAQHLLPMPEATDFPVLVAVRMSLSFPVLLSAVPIHMLDPREHADGAARTCWFSDGGISSNFPLHFFDSSIPGRPTFAINLKEVDKAAGASRVTLPVDNRGGLERPWKGIPENDPTAALTGFLLAIFNVMQNWRDNSLLRLPGYRDRVASVQLEPHEGGLNLTMPQGLITRLAGYGEEAAEQLEKHFLPQNAAICKAEKITTTWENHRWVRLLTALAGMERLTGEMKNVWATPQAGETSYRDLLDPGKTPTAPDYPNFTDEQRRFALKSLEDVEAALEACRKAMPAAPPMADNTPRPSMHFRLTPDA